MALRLRSVAHSEIGLVRKNNQDSGFTSDQFLMVADGMGGAAAGDLASAVAVHEVRKLQTEQESSGKSIAGQDMVEVLAGVVSRANDTIADLIDQDPALEGMGTTVTAAMFDGNQLALVHIGDSRAYLLRDGVLSRLTHDHSWVQSLIDEGRITEDEAHYHPHRSLLLKVLNGQPVNEPDLKLIDVRAGDRLLLCSDGLCGLVDDEALSDDLNGSLDQTLTALIRDAHSAGGIDNITIVLADVLDDSDGAATEVEVLGAAALHRAPSSAEPTHRLDQAGGDVPPASVESAARPVGAASRAALGTQGGEEHRYALSQLPSGRRRAAKGFGIGLLVLAIVAALLGGGYAWSRTQFFVGASPDDKVAIFRGLNEGVMGLSLGEVFEVQPTQIADLPPFYQEQLRAGIDSADLDGARQTVDELRVLSEGCIAQREKRARATTAPKPPASPSPESVPAPPSTDERC